MSLRIADEASLTDVGRQRHTNEDSYFADAPVFAVADGMGGAQAGEVASAMAVEEFRNGHDDSLSPEEQLEDLARAANRRIWEMSQNDQQRAGMGTTLTAVMVGESEVSVGHVGDSRLYLLRDGTLERLTRDHSLVEEFVRQGKLTPEQAERHPQRSVITRALGPESDVEVDTFSVPARDGDVYVLCSDGLSGMVRDDQMEEILAGGGDLDGIAKALIDAANENGGRDNITVVLFRLEDDGTGAAAGDATASDATIAGQEQAPSTEEIEQARATASRASPAPAPSPAASARPRPAEPKRGRRLTGRVLARVLATLALIGAAGYGLWELSRQFWFLGTNDDGAVTLYRGVPYELPLELELYEERYVSGLPAAAIPAERRDRILDHQLRSRDDAVELLRLWEVRTSR